jgi:hypothetical protein
MSATNIFAASSASLEIYPFEGGPYYLTGGQIREITMEKSLLNGSVGRAIIRLAPGGPLGPESIPDWTQVITPMSHILIGMSRGSRSAIILDGVVIKINETQEWITREEGSVVGRFPVLEVADFAWFFRTFNWYALTFLGMTAGAAVGEALGFQPAGIPAILSSGEVGLLGGWNSSNSGPAVVAKGWYDKIMAGDGGILNKTFVTHQRNSRIYFHDILSTVWENYPKAFIPIGMFFMATEQTWMDKFLTMLPWPWYEFFITTATVDDYKLASGASSQSTDGRVFTMDTQPNADPAGPALVARVSPIPTLAMTAGDNPAFGDLDMTKWNALTLVQPDSSFFMSNVEFDTELAYNYYVMNPMIASGLYGNDNANTTPFTFAPFASAADPASIHRYGYRPNIGTTYWFFDPTGTAGQDQSLDIPGAMATILGKRISAVHPMPLMARAAVTLPLMPDVKIGTRFRYQPFKDNVTWDFYIEEVTHHFIFGGPSTTALTLSRGLPTSVYNDVSLLKDVVTGNAMRVGGVYKSGLPDNTGPSLTAFGPPETVIKIMGELATIFVTPQANTTTTSPASGSH